VDPYDIALETAGTLLVVDIGAGTSGRGSLFRVNAVSGIRTQLSDFGNSTQGPLGTNPYGVAVR
jgi:hypothetical protein